MSFQPRKDSSYDDGNNENGEDSISSGGSDWSTYVNYLSRTPERSSSPVLAEDDSKPEVKIEVDVPSVLSGLNLQPAGQAADKPIYKAVIDPEAQVPTSSAPTRDEPPPTPGPSKSSKSARVAVPVYPILAPRLKTKLQALSVKTEVKGPPALLVPNLQPAGQAADKRMAKSVIDPKAQVPTTSAPPPTPGPSKSSKSARAAAQPYSIPTPRSTLRTVAGRRAVQLVPPNSNLANRLDLESVSRAIAMRPYPILTPAVKAKLEALMKKKKTEVNGPPALSVPNQQKAGEAADKPVDKAVIDPETQVPTTSAAPRDEPPPTTGHSKSSQSARAAVQPYRIVTLRSPLRTAAGRRPVQLVPSNSDLATQLDLESISRAVEECGARPVTDTRSEHPLAISQYFNSLSRHIISSRISRARYLWLRHQIIRSVLLALEDPDMPTTTSLFKPF